MPPADDIKPSVDPTKEEAVKTRIRTSTGQPIEVVDNRTGQKQTMAPEANAVYIEDEEDIDTLLKLVASGRQIIGFVDLKDKKVALTATLLPTKVSTVTPFSDKAKGIL